MILKSNLIGFGRMVTTILICLGTGLVADAFAASNSFDGDWVAKYTCGSNRFGAAGWSGVVRLTIGNGDIRGKFETAKPTDWAWEGSVQNANLTLKAKSLNSDNLAEKLEMRFSGKATSVDPALLASGEMFNNGDKRRDCTVALVASIADANNSVGGALAKTEGTLASVPKPATAKSNSLGVSAIEPQGLQHLRGVELFDGGKPRAMKLADPIGTMDTVGGYSFYQGEGKWRMDDLKVSGTTGAGNIQIGNVRMVQREGPAIFAIQGVATNLNESGDSRSWSGSPCSPGHLAIINQGRGREDRCMTVDVDELNAGGKPLTFIYIKITVTGSSGRYFASSLGINPELLGFKGTTKADWSEVSLNSSPYKKAFVGKVAEFGEKLLASSIRAANFDKPNDAFAGIPSWRTLMPVPVAIDGQKFSLEFISAAEDLKNRNGYAAIAYSAYSAPPGNLARWSTTTQEDADAGAFAACNKDLPAGTKTCKIYRMENQPKPK
jgi:hypothetical protein